jgi:hypothetical protein
MRLALVAFSVFSAACGDSTPATSDGGTLPPGRDGAVPRGDGGTTPVITGDVVTGVYDVATALPALPRLELVRGVLNDDSVAIAFEPVDGARDYRVYALPADGDVEVRGSEVVIPNATYRCAGLSETPAIPADGGEDIPGAGIRSIVDGMVFNHPRTLADATLGHVYIGPGDGRVPVYAMGDPRPSGDNACFWARFQATRVKVYTASEADRTRMLAEGWRDDGIAFYVPAAEGSNTRPVYTKSMHDDFSGVDHRLYLIDGPEQDERDGERAFIALDAAEEGTRPLYRVHLVNSCGASHDELVRGDPAFERVRHQGEQPVTELLFTGVTEQMTLVVEALDSGCPFQGRLAAGSIPEFTTENGIFHQAAFTIDDVRETAPDGEVFINGQADTDTRPRAIARAFLHVEPRPHPEMDWFEDFSAPLAAFEDVECGALDRNCFQMWRQRSSDYDVNWHTMDTDSYVMGPVMGELWLTYSDWAADTNGKFRLTPLTRGNVSADSFLHATMEVDAISTGRRYPQLIVSDREAPIQYVLTEGSTIVVQTRGDWPNELELQVCDHRYWDVNDQCPGFHLHERKDELGEVIALEPNAEVGEHTGVDRRTRIDLFLSSRRAYLLLDAQPFACVDLPESGVPSGEVSVTFGDVLYHSGVDHVRGFHARHMLTETERNFDNLGFSSGVPAPAWDEGRFPCRAPSTIQTN